MKKAFPILALLVVLAGVIAFTQRRTGSAGTRFAPGTRGGTGAGGDGGFLHLPDLERTAARWEKGEFHAIAQEPEWEAAVGKQFLEFWKNAFLEDPESALLFRVWPELKKAAPAEFFVAATTVEYTWLPKLVCGFSFRGKKTDVEGVVRLKDHLFAQWPGAKAELSSHSGIEIETITSPDFLSGLGVGPSVTTAPIFSTRPAGATAPSRNAAPA